MTTVVDVMDCIHASDGVGAGANFDYFAAILSPERRIFGAPIIRSELSNISRSNYDYFVLKPGEREVFIVMIYMIPKYHYHFRVGIQYSYKGVLHTKYIDEVFEAVGPSIVKNWLLDINRNKFVYQGQGEVHDEQYDEILRDEMKEYDEKVFSVPSFKVPSSQS